MINSIASQSSSQNSKLIHSPPQKSDLDVFVDSILEQKLTKEDFSGHGEPAAHKFQAVIAALNSHEAQRQDGDLREIVANLNHRHLNYVNQWLSFYRETMTNAELVKPEILSKILLLKDAIDAELASRNHDVQPYSKGSHERALIDALHALVGTQVPNRVQKTIPEKVEERLLILSKQGVSEKDSIMDARINHSFDSSASVFAQGIAKMSDGQLHDLSQSFKDFPSINQSAQRELEKIRILVDEYRANPQRLSAVRGTLSAPYFSRIGEKLDKLIDGKGWDVEANMANDLKAFFSHEQGDQFDRLLEGMNTVFTSGLIDEAPGYASELIKNISEQYKQLAATAYQGLQSESHIDGFLTTTNAMFANMKDRIMASQSYDTVRERVEQSLFSGASDMPWDLVRKNMMSSNNGERKSQNLKIDSLIRDLRFISDVREIPYHVKDVPGKQHLRYGIGHLLNANHTLEAEDSSTMGSRSSIENFSAGLKRMIIEISPLLSDIQLEKLAKCKGFGLPMSTICATAKELGAAAKACLKDSNSPDRFASDLKRVIDSTVSLLAFCSPPVHDAPVTHVERIFASMSGEVRGIFDALIASMSKQEATMLADDLSKPIYSQISYELKNMASFLLTDDKSSGKALPRLPGSKPEAVKPLLASLDGWSDAFQAIQRLATARCGKPLYFTAMGSQDVDNAHQVIEKTYSIDIRATRENATTIRGLDFVFVHPRTGKPHPAHAYFGEYPQKRLEQHSLEELPYLNKSHPTGVVKIGDKEFEYNLQLQRDLARGPMFVNGAKFGLTPGDSPDVQISRLNDYIRALSELFDGISTWVSSISTVTTQTVFEPAQRDRTYPFQGEPGFLGDLGYGIFCQDKTEAAAPFYTVLRVENKALIEATNVVNHIKGFIEKNDSTGNFPDVPMYTPILDDYSSVVDKAKFLVDQNGRIEYPENNAKSLHMVLINDPDQKLPVDRLQES